jgi:hypothetical protein
MTPEQLKDLEKAVKKAKRIATEKAGELHDLVEDRLPAAYKEIPVISQATYDACQACARVCPKKCLSHEPAPLAA